jgi:hypothetical protein
VLAAGKAKPPKAAGLKARPCRRLRAVLSSKQVGTKRQSFSGRTKRQGSGGSGGLHTVILTPPLADGAGCSGSPPAR